MTERETRVVVEAPTVRAADDATPAPRLTGYAAVFGVETVIGGAFGSFREVIEPGAFTRALASDVRAVINHNPDLLLGRTTSGTLRLTEDAHGLRYEVDPPDTSYARDLVVSVQRGDITQSSFAFAIPKGGDAWEDATERGGLPLRRITNVDLFDVSPVTYPAYAETSVSARAQERARPLVAAEVAPEQPPTPVADDGAGERERLRWRFRLREVE